MKIHLLVKIQFFLLSLFCFGAYSQEYAANIIPDSLRENANVVVRIDEGVFEIKSSTKCIFSTRIAYTILNKKGERYATKGLSYDNKFIFVNKFQAKLYDEAGKKIKELKSSEIIDQSNISGFSLHEDNRVKIARLLHHSYPYTVEFIIEEEFKTSLFLPAWNFQSSKDMSVEKSVYQIITPADLAIRFKEKHLKNKVIIQKEKSTVSYTWEETGLKAFQTEPMTKEIPLPILIAKPLQAEIDGYPIDLQDWNSYGKWQQSLLVGREEISENTQSYIKNLVQNVAAEKQRIIKIYEYMQSKTRYVSIQLGIGGWQPFPALDVDTKGIGDCKALSNYTKSLLAVAGIKSHYTLVRAGEEYMHTKIEADFPSMQFNHVILCVPLTTEKDTVWLECTSQQQVAGYMGDFTGNRQALLITDNGAAIVNTPRYTAIHNQQKRNATIKLLADGSASVQLKHSYKALQEAERFSTLQKSEEEQKEFLVNTWDLPKFEFLSMKLWRDKSAIPTTYEEANLAVDKLATTSGKRIFIQPNLFSKWRAIPDNTTKRQNDIYLEEDFVEYDTMKFELPENYHVENNLPSTQLTTAFGEYEASVVVKDNTLIYARKLLHKKGTFPKEKYNDLVDFYKKVAKADAAKIVLVNKT